MKRARTPQALWSQHDGEWRDPAEVVSHWQEASSVDAALLRHRVRGAFWETLGRLGATLLVTREYEHLLMALRSDRAGPSATYLRLPHPSGLVADRAKGRVHVACTRNPNQVMDLAPVVGLLPRLDSPGASLVDRPLVPVKTRFLPGSLYLHDLALIQGRLYANAVGHNAVVELGPEGSIEYAWWPRCIEMPAGPLFARNHLQLNSIAAGATIDASFFSASSDRVTARRPGQRHFPVDGTGVIFDGKTREPVVGGLTRPHSARLHERTLWVDNSGYGEVGRVVKGRFEPVLKLPGWTRGLCFVGDVAFVGTSRVIPRFKAYAPGLDVEKSRCGITAFDVKKGTVLGSLTWPSGNQIFALDWLPTSISTGLPFSATKRTSPARCRELFYAFQVQRQAPRARALSKRKTSSTLP